LKTTTRTDKKAEKYTYWSGHINQWKTSGASQSRYCRDHKLVYHQFTYWKQLLCPSKKPRASAGGFIAVPLAQELPPRTFGLTLQLPNGYRIEGIHPDNITLIRDIMQWQS